ncbi:DUF2188 domain-containing protein [Citrobacter freundii]|uniref:DUF2188 domain-containing protein n=2 Tax=Enterobacteriaceae TaxID=543 RepID=UPI0024A73484|nr:DUF2188 domain-containing protein [Citrobacter freundii]WHE71744.1 DUF2188 domain-containing protein [Citrobacter freundii]WHE76618.1 DUF2188 domain-containing protein [Citrobacter freundii]
MSLHSFLTLRFACQRQCWRDSGLLMHLHSKRPIKRAGEAGIALRAEAESMINLVRDHNHNYAASLWIKSHRHTLCLTHGWRSLMDNYHITKDGDKWKLQKEGNTKPSKTADTKAEMIKQTQEFMSDKKASVKIHKVDGKIQEERTYQRKDDPKSSKG